MTSRQVPDFHVSYWHGRQHPFCVVIPVINEGRRIGDLLERMKALDIASQADIIIVDGGSDDGSLARADLESGKVRGLLVKTGGGALSAQLRAAYAFALDEGYDGIITIDGNNKDDPEAIGGFIRALEGGVDFVQGSRFIPGGVGENTPRLRELAVRWIHAPLLSLFSLFRWTDTTQGFRAYSAKMLRDPRIAPFRDVFRAYELLAYLSYRAPRLGFRCLELATKRRYPAMGAVPTKISNMRGNADLLKTLLYACFGFYNPKQEGKAASKKTRAFWFILMVALLYASFYKDAFNIPVQGAIISEARVLNRLIVNDHHGFSSMGGFLVHSPHVGPYSVRKGFWSHKRPPSLYDPQKVKVELRYPSLQGWIFGIIDHSLQRAGVPPKKRWKYMHRLLALSLALALTSLVMLIAAEFGIVAAVLSFIFTFTSPGLVNFGTDLYWMPVLWFLPMLWCWRYYVSRAPPQGRALAIFSAGFFALIMICSLSGYEYLSTILVATGAVVVYGCTRGGFDWPRIFKHGGLLVATGVAGFAAAVAIHLFLLWNYIGSFSKGWDVLLGNAWVRTLTSKGKDGGSAGILDGLSKNWWDKDIQNFFGFLYLKAYDIFTFSILMGLSLLAVCLMRGVDWRSQGFQRLASLFLFALLCLLAPVSWDVLAKNHSVAHHDFAVFWHVPAAIIFPAVVWAMSVEARKYIDSRYVIGLALASFLASIFANDILDPSSGSDKYEKAYLHYKKNIESKTLKPIIRFNPFFNVYKDGKTLIYFSRRRCRWRVWKGSFLIKVFPSDIKDLPPHFQKQGFLKEFLGGHHQHKKEIYQLGRVEKYRKRYSNARADCIFLYQLPDYDIKRIITGFNREGNFKWRGRLHSFNFDDLPAGQSDSLREGR